jgi:hydroxymethylpyrimidine/phosphomethylpyrimidine kinase
MKVVLTIAGSDCSGGAGIQADLKTFEAFGVYGCSVITVLTAQNTQGVGAILPVDTGFIIAQLEAVFDDLEVSAIKIGMLYSSEIIDAVYEFLSVRGVGIPIVFDPVFISKAGSSLLDDDAKDSLAQIFSLCTIATPNLFEAKQLLGYEFAHTQSLDQIFNLPCAVVVKNHTIERDDQILSVDILYRQREKTVFDTPTIDTSSTHGTGCSFSSAIAAHLALGKSLEESVRIAKNFIYEAIKNAPQIGHGKGPIAHRKGGELCQES